MGRFLTFAVAGRHRTVPVFTAARCMMQYLETSTSFCWHWVPLGLVSQRSSERGFSAVLSQSLRELLPSSLSFSGVRETLGDQDDVFYRAAWFVRTSLWRINFPFEWLHTVHPNERLQSSLAARAEQLKGPVWAGSQREGPAPLAWPPPAHWGLLVCALPAGASPPSSRVLQ